MSSQDSPADERTTVKGFLVLSRLPFLSPGLAALLTGVIVGLMMDYPIEPGLIGISILGLTFIMLATYYFNEYYDYEGDKLNRRFTKLSGGSRAIPDLKVPRPVARAAGWASIVVLVAVAVTYLALYFEDYPLLLPLALFGAFCGVFYTSPPLQLAYTGTGEIVIGGCYGVFTMVSGFYLVSGDLSPEIAFIALPASLTIFGVIMANGFPDYEADRAVNKRNIVVRLGPARAAWVYAAAMVLAYPFMVASVLLGVSWIIAILGLPVLLLSVFAAASCVRGGHSEPKKQTIMAAATLVANLLTSLLFVFAYPAGVL